MRRLGVHYLVTSAIILSQFVIGKLAVCTSSCSQLWRKYVLIRSLRRRYRSKIVFQKATVEPVETLTQDQPKAPSLWGFRRRAPVEHAPAPAPAEDAAFASETISSLFQSFGRAGMQLGGLHRDQQWVGAWGGRC
jgi:hypothetical protein